MRFSNSFPPYGWDKDIDKGSGKIVKDRDLSQIRDSGEKDKDGEI